MKKLVEYEKKDKEMNKHIISLRVFYPALLILVDILSAIGFSSFFRFYALWMTSLNISCWMKKLSLAGFNTKAWVNDCGGSSSVWKSKQNIRKKIVKFFSRESQDPFCSGCPNKFGISLETFASKTCIVYKKSLYFAPKKCFFSLFCEL